MGLLHQLLALFILLTAVAFADPPQIVSTDRACNSTANNTYPRIGSGDIVVNYADLMRGPEPERHYDSSTAPATGSTNNPFKGKYAAVIRMGTKKQHVGEFHGQRMFDIIEDALKKICPFERGRIGCYKGMPGALDPNDDNSPKKGQQFYSKYWVMDVPYKSDNGDYGTNAWLTITAQAMYRNQKHPGIGAATYKLAAGVYAKATEHPENCYQESFDQRSRPYQFCNVPSQVMIALPANKGNVIESWLSIKVEFNGDTEFGTFDCYGAMLPVIDFWDNNVEADAAKSMGSSTGEWKTPCTQCFNEANCFDLHTWRDCKKCDYLEYTDV